MDAPPPKLKIHKSSHKRRASQPTPRSSKKRALSSESVSADKRKDSQLQPPHASSKTAAQPVVLGSASKIAKTTQRSASFVAPTLNSKKEKTSTQSVVKIQPGQSFMKGLKPNLEELSESSKKTQATEKEMKPEDKRTASEKNIFSNEAARRVVASDQEGTSSESATSSDSTDSDSENSDSSENSENSDRPITSAKAMNVPVEKNRPEKESHCPVVSTQEFLHFSPVQLAQGRAITTRHVETFVDGGKDKHYHDLKLEPLAGPSNFASWMSGIGVLLAMHQVSFIVRGDFVPLGKTDPLYIWYDHAISVATGLIYAHVSQRVRENSCFMEAVFHRNPEAMLRSIRAHFGDDECATKGFEILEG